MSGYDWDRRWDREHGGEREEARRRESGEHWAEGDPERQHRSWLGEGRRGEGWRSERDRERSEREDWRRNQPWPGENRSEVAHDREYPARSDWGPQGRWGTYGNRSTDWGQEGNLEGGREGGRDSRRETSRQSAPGDWMRPYGSGMGTYGGGIGMYPEPGSFAGRGPKNWHRSDERIREDLNERLTDHPDIDASEIEVQVKNGEVTLTGTVTDRHAKRLTEDVAERVSGVKEVHNQLRVQTTVQSGSTVTNR